MESCGHLSLGAHSTKINATAWQSGSCAIASHVAFSRKTRNFAPFLGVLPPFCKPIGFESGRGQPLSGTQGKRVATFAAKDSSHDRDIHSLRHRHAMLRPRTFVRGDEIIART